MDFKTLDDVDIKNRTVLVRVDINSPLDPETGEIQDDTRFRMCSSTLNELVERGAKTVVMVHQGRPGGRDFTTLKKHAELMSHILNTPVKYVDDIFGKAALDAILGLESGKILFLENVRFYSEEVINKPPEQQARTLMVKKLSSFADLFVNDAFAVAHRSQPSLVGFEITLQSVAGRLMERELKGLGQARRPNHPCVYILGGVKVDDSLSLANHVLGRGIADRVLAGGLVGHALLAAKGLKLGEPNFEALSERGYEEEIDRGKDILSDFGNKLVLPCDIRFEKNRRSEEVNVNQLPVEHQIMDIGPKSIGDFSQIISEAKTVVANGPMGVFERPEFAKGTTNVLRAMAMSEAFTIIGGGHLVAAAREAGVIDQLNHVSTSGGSCLSFLSGKELPVVKGLEQ